MASRARTTRTLKAPAGRGGAERATAHAGSELRILGVESALDLIQHPLLMLGEWHSSLLCRSRNAGFRRGHCRATTHMIRGRMSRTTPFEHVI